MLLNTTEAAEVLRARGVTVRGRGQPPHPPTSRTVEFWCRSGVLSAQHIGRGRAGLWLIDPRDLETFTPPALGRPVETVE